MGGGGSALFIITNVAYMLRYLQNRFEGKTLSLLLCDESMPTNNPESTDPPARRWAGTGPSHELLALVVAAPISDRTTSWERWTGEKWWRTEETNTERGPQPSLKGTAAEVVFRGRSRERTGFSHFFCFLGEREKERVIYVSGIDRSHHAANSTRVDSKRGDWGGDTYTAAR